MRKVIAAILFVMIPFYICSCMNSSTEAGSGQSQAVIYPEAITFDDHDAMQKLRDENPIDDNFYKSVNDFSYESAQVLLENKTENFNYSPLSVYYALALAGTGAGGKQNNRSLNCWAYRLRRSCPFSAGIYTGFFTPTIRSVN